MAAKSFTLNNVDPSRAGVRMLIVPHAGAGSSSSISFRDSAPSEWLVATARLPGRESRVREQVTGLSALTTDVATTIRALPGRAPLIVVGVCSGAIIGFEAIREIQQESPGLVSGLVVVSQAACDPAEGECTPPDGEEDDSDVLESLRKLGGIPDILSEDEGIFKLMLSAISADIRAVKNYRPMDLPLLSCPMLSISGDDDELCPPAAVAGWSKFSEKSRHVRVSGGHMLLTDSADVLVGALVENLDHFRKPTPGA
jgi:surfactin synthase thioesterase subunit